MSREQSDVRTYVTLLWRWRFLVLAILVVIPSGVYVYVSEQPKVYESTVLMQVQQLTVDTSLFSETPPPPQAQILASAARLITTTGVAEAAAKELGDSPAPPRKLLSSVTATADVDAGFITIAARAPTPTRAADVANAFAAAVVTTRREQAVERLNTTIRKVTGELATLRQSDLDGRRQLSQQLQRLRALRAAQGNNATVVEPAVASSTPAAPKVTRTVVLAFIVALLLAGGAVVLAQGADRRLRDPEELERATDRPLLSVVPESAFAENISPAAAEAFQTLRASLTYFNIDQPVTSVLISSPAQGDGKTTVATNLARAMAGAGKDVILVDADLRRPRVTQRLHLRDTAGLGALLVEEVDLERALVEADDINLASGGRLRVLPSGDPPPNPSALLASQLMKNLVGELTGMSDLVIIDSTPLLVVSDSLPLVKVVSGVVAVARLNKTSTDAIDRFERMITNAGGTLLGTVASGATGTDPYGYGYGGYKQRDDPSESGGSPWRRLLPGHRSRRTKSPERIDPVTPEEL